MAAWLTWGTAFASHHWPTWGTDEIVAYLTAQRDLYAYLHDQTLRLINQGYIHSEIAEMIELPPALDREWPGGIGTSGDPAVLGRLMSLIDNPDPDFAIVTP